MKFTCDSCGAAYMISDDKVGPNGVKVRCKKCGNVVTVLRGEAPPPPVLQPVAGYQPAAAGSGDAGPTPPAGLDAELGSAFDHAFGEPAGGPSTAEAALAAAAPAPAPAPAAPSEPAATEWYVAIGEAQVGPLPLAEVKKKWEAGLVGPDSLVWRPGMADWVALSTVADLAAYLAPVPQPAKPSSAPAAAFTAVAAPATPRGGTPLGGTPAVAAPQGAPAAASEPEVTWKPAGASALAAMASEEIATREAPAAPAARPAPTTSLLDAMPDSGGVDPTGALPLSIRGMEPTDERPVPRRSSVARGAEEVRHKRSVRTAVIGIVALVVVAGAAAAAAWLYLNPRPAPPVATLAPPSSVPVAPAPAPIAPPAPAPAVATAPAATLAPAESPPAATAPVEAAPAVAQKPVARPAAAPPAKVPPARPAAGKPVVAHAEPATPPPAAAPPVEKPAPAPAKKGSSALDVDGGGDDDLAAALGTGSGGRSVYVPPKAATASSAPEQLSQAQILESVKLHVDALRRCASEQQAREPGAKGSLKMAWTIQPDGSTRDVRCLTPDLASGPFAQCIGGVVRGIRFPKLSGAGQPVTFPFSY